MDSGDLGSSKEMVRAPKTGLPERSTWVLSCHPGSFNHVHLERHYNHSSLRAGHRLYGEPATETGESGMGVRTRLVKIARLD